MKGSMIISICSVKTIWVHRLMMNNNLKGSHLCLKRLTSASIRLKCAKITQKLGIVPTIQNASSPMDGRSYIHYLFLKISSIELNPANPSKIGAHVTMASDANSHTNKVQNKQKNWTLKSWRNFFSQRTKIEVHFYLFWRKARNSTDD